MQKSENILFEINWFLRLPTSPQLYNKLSVILPCEKKKEKKLFPEHPFLPSIAPFIISQGTAIQTSNQLNFIASKVPTHTPTSTYFTLPSSPLFSAWPTHIRITLICILKMSILGPTSALLNPNLWVEHENLKFSYTIHVHNKVCDPPDPTNPQIQPKVFLLELSLTNLIFWDRHPQSCPLPPKSYSADCHSL